MPKPKVLIVDDDPHIREVVRFALDQAGMETAEAKDGADGLQRAQQTKYDLIMLDITMPEMDGTELCKRLRQKSNVPIIFMSSRDDEIDRVLGLEIGGDDYITKPFSPRELVARAKAVLRRTERKEPPQQTLTHLGIELDLARFELRHGKHAVPLTATEFGILRTLFQYPGKVYTRSELMDGAFDGDRFVSDRTIDSHIKRVRAKLEKVGKDVIETLHGIGYKLKDE
jgi:two-component system OmpR family response regulator